MKVGRRAFVLGGAGAAVGCRPRPRGDDPLVVWHALGGEPRRVLGDLVAGARAARGVDARLAYQGDYFETLAKLRTALAAGRAPDVCQVVAEVVPYLGLADALEPLDAAGVAADADAEDLFPALAQEGAFSAGAPARYGLPFNRSVPVAYGNAALLAEVGAELPRTWDELVVAAKALTRGGRFGFSVPLSWWFWVALLYQAGGALFDGAGRPTFHEEPGVRATELLARLVHVDRSMRPPPGRDYDAWSVASQEFLAGRTAMLWSSSAYLRHFEATARFPVAVAPLPRGPGGAGVPTGGTFFVVPRGTPPARKARARALLGHLAGETASRALATRTGYLPLGPRAAEALRREGPLAPGSRAAVALDALGAARPWPWHRDLFRVQRDVLEPRLERALLEGGSPRAALEDARRAYAEDP